jgi:hypothetical protein
MGALLAGFFGGFCFAAEETEGKETQTSVPSPTVSSLKIEHSS